MAKSQKQAVIDEVLSALPGFNINKDNALSHLTNTQLETIKSNIAHGIGNLVIDYGKDPHNTSEVRSYARSMVMNHLKKAKELNGGSQYIPTTTATSTANKTKSTSTNGPKMPKGVDYDSLPDNLKEIATKLV